MLDMVGDPYICNIILSCKEIVCPGNCPLVVTRDFVEQSLVVVLHDHGRFFLVYERINWLISFILGFGTGEGGCSIRNGMEDD